MLIYCVFKIQPIDLHLYYFIQSFLIDVEWDWNKNTYFQVVGHRPVCSCPSGTQNIDGACKSDTSCQWNERRYENGQHYYDSNCEQRCECLNGEFTCRPTSCEEGLKAKGKLDNKVRLKFEIFSVQPEILWFQNQCIEKSHPSGDECCVLWVCKDPCENISCNENSKCDINTGDCVCEEGFTRSDFGGACIEIVRTTLSPADGSNINLLQITPTSIQVQLPDNNGGNLAYIETRLFGRKDPGWENAILVKGSEIFTLTGLKPDTSYTLRWKTPDRQYPDVQVCWMMHDWEDVLLDFHFRPQH